MEITMFLTPAAALTISSSEANLGGDGGTAPSGPKDPDAKVCDLFPDSIRALFPPPVIVTAEDRAGEAIAPGGIGSLRGDEMGVVASDSVSELSPHPSGLFSVSSCLSLMIS